MYKEKHLYSLISKFMVGLSWRFICYC